MNEKGLSDVITTVLIILLVIAAIVIIWGFVGPLITRTGQTINYQAECLNVEAKPTACTASTGTVVVQLSRNSTNIPIGKITAILQNSAAGTSATADLESVPTTLSTSSVDVSTESVGTSGTTATAVVYLQKSDGSYYPCTPYQPALACTVGE